jgi:hypothetical protein
MLNSQTGLEILKKFDILYINRGLENRIRERLKLQRRV